MFWKMCFIIAAPLEYYKNGSVAFGEERIWNIKTVMAMIV